MDEQLRSEGRRIEADGSERTVVRAVISSALDWLRRVIGAGTADAVRYPAGKMGRQTTRFLRTVGPSLSGSELDWITSLGESEGVLSYLRTSLSDLGRGAAAIDRDANAMKARIDAFLSEPGGLLVRTLAPIRNQAPAESKRRIETARMEASRLVTDARSVLDTVDSLVTAKARLDALVAKHRGVLPETLDRMLGGTRIADRLQTVSAPASARRLLAGVEEIERSIERQKSLYEDLARELERSASAAGIDSEALRRKACGLEEYTRALEAKVDATFASRRSAAFKRALRTARQHHKRLEADGGFVRSGESVEGMPSHAAIREWKALHVMKPIVALQESGE